MTNERFPVATGLADGSITAINTQDLNDALQTIKDQRAEIERLTEENRELQDRVVEVERCARELLHGSSEPGVCATCGGSDEVYQTGSSEPGPCPTCAVPRASRDASLPPLTPYGEELLSRAKLCQCGICEACEFAEKHAQRTGE